MKLKTHNDLRVYQLGMDAAMQIHCITALFPQEEKYSLTDQIRRSSRSVCANLAEAFRKRRYEKAFIAKLSDCEGEAAETQVWLEFSKNFKYITNEEFTQLTEIYDNILAKLSIMITIPEKWTY
jgi:four helix bundle protein